MNGRFYKLQRPSMQLKNKTLTMNSTLSIHKNREMGNIKKQNKTIYINGKAFKLLKKKKSIKERTKEISEEIKENLKELRKCKENKKYYWHEFMKKYYQ